MFVRLFTGADGESHFEDMDPKFVPNVGAVTSKTALHAAEGVAFNMMPPGYFSDWHLAPARQYVITVTGAIEITVGDGSSRRFGPGDVFLAEDVTGHGHQMRVVSDEVRISAQVPLRD